MAHLRKLWLAVATGPAGWLLAVALLAAGACGPANEPADRQAPGTPAGSGEAAPAARSSGLPAGPPLPDPPFFVDATAESGLDFVHFNGMTGAFYMPENLGSGAALFDWDGDGDLDVYLVQGREIGPGRPSGPTRHTDRLYRNDLERPGSGHDGSGDGPERVRLTDVTAEAGLPPALYGMGVAAGDVDNDGRVDLYVTGFGANRLLLNRPDGTFEDATVSAGVDDRRWSVPAVFFDYDRDGWLDLFVGNYLDFTLDTHRPCTTLTGAPDYCDPSVYDGVGDRLFHNLGPSGGAGGVRFEDVTEAAGLGAATGKALGAVAFDADGDGWLDLYVANDGTPNFLWMNRGGEGESGRFEETALLAGCAVNDQGLPEASMGVDAGDPDQDGDQDLVMAHFAEETDTFYRNDGTGLFEDRSVPAGIAAPSLEANGFGTAWLDFDADGLLDLLVVNGTVRAVEDLLRAGDPYPYHQPNQLFHNLGVTPDAGGGQVHFEEVSDRAGEPITRSEVSRGAAVGDVDQDGDPDVVISNSAGPARLVLDVAADGRPWVGVRALLPAPSRSRPTREHGKAEPVWRDALGARVGLELDGAPTLWRRVGTDGSYASARDPRVLFGLAGAEDHPVRKVVVRWPDGSVEEFPPPPAGRYTTLRQGAGRSRATAGEAGR